MLPRHGPMPQRVFAESDPRPTSSKLGFLAKTLCFRVAQARILAHMVAEKYTGHAAVMPTIMQTGSVN